MTQNGIASQSFSITIQRDNIHILNTCDHYPSAGLPLIGCYPIVTHPDGSLVSAMAPAAAGEEIVLYAFGLGATDPVVNTGDAAPLPAPVLANKQLVYVQFDFRVNATPSPPYLNPLIEAEFAPVALFNGLTPGEVRLYQINVRIPSLPNLMACSPRRGGPPYQTPPYYGVATNLTIDIGALDSFDGAAICVAPPVVPPQ